MLEVQAPSLKLQRAACPGLVWQGVPSLLRVLGMARHLQLLWAVISVTRACVYMVQSFYFLTSKLPGWRACAPVAVAAHRLPTPPR